MKNRTVYRYRFCVTKTAAGVAIPAFNFRIGRNGNIADPTILTILGTTAQTAAADTGIFEIDIICEGDGTTMKINSTMCLTHVLTVTGFTTTGQIAIKQTETIAFDGRQSGRDFIGVSVDPGAAAVWTFQSVTAECLNGIAA